MALSENGRGIDRAVQGDNIEAVFTFLKQAPAGGIYDVGKGEDQKISPKEIPHVQDINEYASRIVEAEIARRFPVPVERRSFSVKKFVSLLPTILG